MDKSLHLTMMRFFGGSGPEWLSQISIAVRIQRARIVLYHCNQQVLRNSLADHRFHSCCRIALVPFQKHQVRPKISNSFIISGQMKLMRCMLKRRQFAEYDVSGVAICLNTEMQLHIMIGSDPVKFTWYIDSTCTH